MCAARIIGAFSLPLCHVRSLCHPVRLAFLIGNIMALEATCLT